MPEWFEDESFWESFYPVMFPEQRFEAAVEQVDQVLARAGVWSGNALDLCCGPGRHSVLLAKRGFTVTGVDRTPFLLDKARERAEQEGVHVEWIEQDMRDFVRPDGFDLVVNLFTSFGYFDDKDEDRKVLANIHESLCQGGVFVIDVIGKEYLARVFQPVVETVLGDGTVFLQRHEVYDDWSRIRNQWLLLRGDEIVRTFRFHHTVYSAQELKDCLGEAGFARVEVFGHLDGRPYDHIAQRLVAVARKA